MKKLLTSIMVVMVMLFGLAIVQPEQTIQQASAYDRYLNGDTNYKLINGHMDTAIYLDISSVTVKMNDPHQIYLWAQNEVTVATNRGNAIIDTRTKWYSWYNDGSDSGQFAWSSNGKNWNVFRLDDLGPNESTAAGFSAGFYYAFGFPFS